MKRSIVVLLAEDNEADAELVREILRSGELKPEVHVVRDGVEAMRFLRREGPYQDAPAPDLVLLDLNMPRLNGREVLKHARAIDELRKLPFVVLTSSDAPDDVGRSYEAGANSYVTKPISFAEYRGALRGIEEYWFETATLP